jgi:hypothetical protein
MNIRERIAKLESEIFPSPDTNREEWMAQHREEIESKMDEIWAAVNVDYLRFPELLKSGAVTYPGIKPYWTFWTERGISKDDENLTVEINSASAEYFSAPEDEGDKDWHFQPGEDWPNTAEDALAFLEAKTEIIMGFMALRRFRQTSPLLGTFRISQLHPW